MTKSAILGDSTLSGLIQLKLKILKTQRSKSPANFFSYLFFISPPKQSPPLLRGLFSLSFHVLTLLSERFVEVNGRDSFRSAGRPE